jgi:antitoxin ParD1/3/4
MFLEKERAPVSATIRFEPPGCVKIEGVRLPFVGLSMGNFRGSSITGFDSFLLFVVWSWRSEFFGILIMNVSLTPELAKFVEKEVESGLYQTASEVVRAGLRRLKEDKSVRLPQVPTTLEELEAQLLQSIDRLDRGEGVDGEAVFRRLRKRIKQSRSDA